jgi:L-ascorbate metabolism protein UlaG (beta-lactamase superfamily)
VTVKFTWIGGPTFLLELGSFRILGDPVFADAFDMTLAGAVARVTRTSPLSLPDLSRLDLVCASCFRADHFDPAAHAHLDPSTPLASPREGADECGFADRRALAWGESADFEKGAERLAVHAVRAEAANGYFFRHTAGGADTTAYWTGDARWSDAVRDVQREHGYSNLLIQHLGAEPGAGPGERRSVDGKEAMQFVYRMQPNAVVAVHHHTFSHYTEPIGPFVEWIGKTIYEKRLRILSEGESFEKA